jgi:hypothetical protein
MLMVDEALLVEDGEAHGEAIGRDEGVDRLGEVDEVLGKVISEAVVPVGEGLDVDADELIDVALAQALLGLGGDADVEAVALDGGRADGSSAGRGSKGESSEETHLED